MSTGKVDILLENKVSRIVFSHPKSNSLPGEMLSQLATAIETASKDQNTNVILIASEGEKAFCAGASFEELLDIDNEKQGKNYFMGFAGVINALRKSPKLSICRVQGRAVGGGVGLIAACDYVYATDHASVKLSEFALGIGPFVVGPAVERKIGRAAFSQMAIDCEWRDATWARNRGLYTETFESINELDEEVNDFSQRLSENSPAATAELKKMFWLGTEDWDGLLAERAAISGRLVVSDFTMQYIRQFKSK